MRGVKGAWRGGEKEKNGTTGVVGGLGEGEVA